MPERVGRAAALADVDRPVDDRRRRLEEAVAVGAHLEVDVDAELGRVVREQVREGLLLGVVLERPRARRGVALERVGQRAQVRLVPVAQQLAEGVELLRRRAAVLKRHHAPPDRRGRPQRLEALRMDLADLLANPANRALLKK